MKELKDRLKQMYVRGEKENAIQELEVLLPTQSGTFAKQFSQWKARWEDIQSRTRRKAITAENEQLFLGQLFDDFFVLVDMLGEKEEGKTSTVHSEEAGKAQTYTILFLAANPEDTGRLRLDEELREIRESIQLSTYRDRFSLEERFAVRPLDLSRAMLNVNPNIVHFSGHGIAPDSQQSAPGSRSLMLEEGEKDRLSGGIALEDNDGNTHLVPPEDLGYLFKLYEGKIQCVLLNACHSQLQADAIVQHVPYVIGMNTAIPDKTAISFAIAFYDALGAGREIPFAFEHAKAHIGLAGLPGRDIPQLIRQ